MTPEELENAMGQGRALAEYIKLVKDVDRAMERMAERHGGDIRCAAGCDECCMTSRSALAVEGYIALMAAKSLGKAKARALLGAALKSKSVCPMLDGGLCAIYGARPIICRTHGAPLLVDTGDEQGIALCELNFEGRDPLKPFEPGEVIDTTLINERLARINRAFTGSAFPQEARIDLLDVLKAAAE